jgi:hypothetical protein
MKELKLKERKENVNVTFEPIDAGNGLTIVASKSVNNGKRMLQCDLKKDGKDIGHASWNDDAKRLFLQIFPMDELTEEEVRDASGTMLQCILQMLND